MAFQSLSAFPVASQYKLKSAAHWQLIAEDVAGQMKQSLMTQDPLQAAIYVEEPAQPTAFEKSWLPMLRAGLLSQGLKVSARPQAAAVRPDLQELPHRPMALHSISTQARVTCAY